jgi:hypothetical protein
VSIDEELLAATQCENCGHARSLHRPGYVVDGCRCEWYANREGGVVGELVDQARCTFNEARRLNDDGVRSDLELLRGAVYHVGAELARLLEERLPEKPADPPGTLAPCPQCGFLLVRGIDYAPCTLPPCASCGHAYAQHGQGCCFGNAHLGELWACRCTCYVMSVTLGGATPAGGCNNGT